jgi:serine protease Do
MKRIRSTLGTTLIAAPLTIAAAGLLIAAAPTANKQALPKSTPAVELSSEAIGVANSLSDAFRKVAAHVLPAVVAIENRPDTSWQAVRQPLPPNGNIPGQDNPFAGTPFEDLFRNQTRNQIPGSPRLSPRQAPQRSGIGSGVIIDSAGIVLTNNHVVAGGGKIVIKTNDGREFVATEVLTDPQTDIAVVKFSGDASLRAAKLGDSDAIAVGDWVVALGQPFGLESTVTAGIVSAKNRGIGITARENFIQTDAAINPGNSGGPLVNLRGEVIGINTAISSRDGGSNGVGFAVPANLAGWVSGQLIDNGQVTRSYLGVGIQPVNYALATQLGVPPKSGVVVTNVFPSTPAEKSGLQSGDVIVRFGGTAVSTPQQLQLAVERSPLGKSLTMNIIRGGNAIELDYTPETAPNDVDVSQSQQPVREGVKLKPLGMEVNSLSPAVAKQLGLDDPSGVIVTSVQNDSPAATAGIEPGMLIVQVNSQDVSTPAEFQSVVDRDTDGTILLLVRSSQGSRFVVIRQ